MKISLHSVSYSGTVTADQVALSLDDFLRKASHLGFDGVSLGAKRPHALPMDLPAGRRQAIRNLAAFLGLEIVCIAAYNDFADPAPFNRQVQLAYVIDCINLARDLGAPIVRTFASGMGSPHDAPLSQQVRWVIEMAREAVAFAEEQGVTLVIQNHSPIGNNVHTLLQIVKAVNSPAYRAAVDCPLLQHSSVDYAEALQAAKEVLAFSTAGDSTPVPGPIVSVGGGRVQTWLAEGVPLGQGECDWPRFLGLLREVGYDYWINYEMCSPMRGGGSEANLDRVAAESLRYLRGLL